MAAQLKISTSPSGLKQMSGTDYEYQIYQILAGFASSSTGVGTVQVNPASTTGLTLIGTFTDTYFNALPGDHPVGTTPISVSYNFYQDLQTASEASMYRPVEFINGALREWSDTSLNTDIMATALANLVASGVGMYSLQSTTPTGGTWTSQATVTNTLDGATTNVTYLWRKTSASAPGTTVRPLRINTSTSPKSLKEFTDADIQTLTTRLRNRIVQTGIGRYAVQATAPVSGGTWVTSGAQFLDTRRTLTDTGYNTTYTGVYAGVYNTTYTGAYTRAYSGSYTGSYSGAYTRTFSGTYSGSYTGTVFYSGFARNTAYAGSYIGNYNTAYTGAYAGAYAGSYNTTYTGAYTAAYTGAYTGAYTRAYTGQTLNNDSTTISNVYLWVRTA